MIYFVLLCGGKGTRTGLDTPKQYFEVANKPIFAYSIDKFNNINSEKHLIIAAEPEYFSIFKPYIDAKCTTFVKAGSCRQKTVYNALKSVKQINPEDIVIIHDSARMFATDLLIENLIKEIENGKNSAIPYKNLTSAVFSDKNNKYIDRNDLKIIETPQAFNFYKLKVAYLRKKLDNFIDDGSIYFSKYHEINFIYNPDFNFKITSKEDLEEAERRIR